MHLLESVRRELSRLALCCVEKRMFGGITQMLAGNMLCSVSRRGLMVRVGTEGEAEALAQPGAQPCMATGRRMAGFVMVDDAVLRDPRDVAKWLQRAHAHVSTLPAKQGKVAPSKKQRS